MEHSGSGWPSNARFGSWPASGSLQFQLSAKLLGLLYVHVVTWTVWGYSISPQFPVRNYSVTPRDEGILKITSVIISQMYETFHQSYGVRSGLP